ncbi:MAG: anthranilate synthase component II [Bacteroidota bacterium]
MDILVLDNYDSFTWNLVHIIRDLGYPVTVVRNDKISLEEVGHYNRILLSPGPGVPDSAGIMKDVIRTYGPTRRILGVCLGLQGIAEVYGGKLFNLPDVLHGVTSQVAVAQTSDPLFRGLPSTFRITHYHSWVVDPEFAPADLKITATSGGRIMAMSHAVHQVHGVQFHPESVMTEHGAALINNWITYESTN